MSDKKMITIETTVNSPAEKVWEYWTTPEHIMQWNNASDDWHTPSATVDLKEGGRFTSRMEAKDASMVFDFGGLYTKIVEYKTIEFTMDDGRTVNVLFEEKEGSTHISESFEAEMDNPIEMQQQGWQAILNNFKKYVESRI